MALYIAMYSCTNFASRSGVAEDPPPLWFQSVRKPHGRRRCEMARKGIPADLLHKSRISFKLKSCIISTILYEHESLIFGGLSRNRRRFGPNQAQIKRRDSHNEKPQFDFSRSVTVGVATRLQPTLAVLHR